MQYRVLFTEIERNLEMARSTRNLLSEERDMLQGDVKPRLVLHTFHTDVWDAAVNHGDIGNLGAADTLASCYQYLKEVNELIAKFSEVGDSILHSPLVSRDGHDYGRDKLLDLLQERCEEAEHHLQEAYHQVEEYLERACPYCGDTFADASRLDTHIDEKHDGER